MRSDRNQRKAARLEKRQRKLERKVARSKPYGRPALAVSGAITGGVLGGMLQLLLSNNRSIIGVVLGTVLGLALCLGVGKLIANQNEKTRMQVQFSVCGLLPGFMIVGNKFLIQQKWGGPLGAILFFLLFGGVLAPLIHRRRVKGKYLPFPGEGVVFTLFSLLTSYAGDQVAQSIIHSKLFYVAHGKQVIAKTHQILTVMIPKTGFGFTVGKEAIAFLLPFLLVLISFLWIGWALAANQKRPAFGAALTAIGGCMVSYLGLKVAPMLFEPGSGLMWAGLVVGLLMVAMALTAFYYSLLRVPLGVVIIVLSVLSFIGAAGGLIVGGILGIFGGAMIATWAGPAEEKSHSEPRPTLPPSQGVSV